MYVYHIRAYCGGKKMVADSLKVVLDSLKVELQMVVNHYVDARKQTPVLPLQEQPVLLTVLSPCIFPLNRPFAAFLWHALVAFGGHYSVN